MRRIGSIHKEAAAAAPAFHRIELNPVSVIELKEFGVISDEPPNSTIDAHPFELRRTSTVGSGGGPGTVVPASDEQVTALTTTAIVDNTADGTPEASLLGFYLDMARGFVYPVDPHFPFDCSPANFLGLRNEIVMGGGIKVRTWMIFEE